MPDCGEPFIKLWRRSLPGSAPEARDRVYLEYRKQKEKDDTWSSKIVEFTIAVVDAKKPVLAEAGQCFGLIYKPLSLTVTVVDAPLAKLCGSSKTTPVPTVGLDESLYLAQARFSFVSWKMAPAWEPVCDSSCKLR